MIKIVKNQKADRSQCWVRLKGGWWVGGKRCSRVDDNVENPIV